MVMSLCPDHFLVYLQVIYFIYIFIYIYIQETKLVQFIKLEGSAGATEHSDR